MTEAEKHFFAESMLRSAESWFYFGQRYGPKMCEQNMYWFLLRRAILLHGDGVYPL